MEQVHSEDRVTQLLHRWQAGDEEAISFLVATLMPELRRIAGHVFRGERPDHTLQPTALVNEAVLRLLKIQHIEWKDRRHFLAVAATVMRRLLVDYARSQPAIKAVHLDAVPEHVLGLQSSPEFIVQLDTLLDDLERESPQRRLLIELKFFVGLTDTEAADAMNLKLHTFQREWFRSRKWLFQRMS